MAPIFRFAVVATLLVSMWLCADALREQSPQHREVVSSAKTTSVSAHHSDAGQHSGSTEHKSVEHLSHHQSSEHHSSHPSSQHHSSHPSSQHHSSHPSSQHHSSQHHSSHHGSSKHHSSKHHSSKHHGHSSHHSEHRLHSKHHEHSKEHSSPHQHSREHSGHREHSGEHSHHRESSSRLGESSRLTGSSLLSGGSASAAQSASLSASLAPQLSASLSSLPAPAPVSTASAAAPAPVAPAPAATLGSNANAFSNPSGAKVTIVSNKNRLVHLRTQGEDKKRVNPRIADEQARKETAEDQLKREAEKDREQRRESAKKQQLSQEVESKRLKEQSVKDDRAEAQRRRQLEQEKKAQVQRREAELKEQDRQQTNERKQKEAEQRAKNEEGDKQNAQRNRQAREQQAKQQAAARKQEQADKKQVEEREKQSQEQEKKKTSITFQSGWKAYGDPYQPARLDRWNNWCFLSGLGAGNGGHIVTTGSACRPGGGRLIFNLLKGDAPSRVDLLPDGRLIHVIAGGGGWLSLNGASFTVDSPMPLQLTGWVPYGSGYRAPSASTAGGLCGVSGLIRQGPWGNLAQVGGECQPDGRLVFAVNTHEQSARVDVAGPSVVFVTGNQRHHWVSLDGIAFTKQAGQSLNLQNGWINYGQGYRGASYVKIGSLCSLSGLIKSPSWQSVIAVLPQECRPQNRLVFAANVHTSSARIDIQPSGDVIYVSGKQQWEWISLDNIKFVIPAPKPIAVTSPVGSPVGPVVAPGVPVATPAGPVAGLAQPVATPAGPVAGLPHPVATPAGAVAGPAQPVAGGINNQLAGHLGALAHQGAQLGVRQAGGAIHQAPILANHLNPQQRPEAHGVVNHGAHQLGGGVQHQVAQHAPGLLNRVEQFGHRLIHQAGGAIHQAPILANHLNAQQRAEAHGAMNHGAHQLGGEVHHQVAQHAPGWLNRVEQFGRRLVY